MIKGINIVSFDVPYPPDYGGVIDVYYRIKTLYEMGVEVHLHTYEYGRGQQPELQKICTSVTYYKRRIYRDPFFTKLPYIIASRNSSQLLENLLKNDFPILFEGMHCCYYLSEPALKNRYKIVRMHNLEHIYYKSLARIEKNLIKRYFFAKEASRLQKFLPILKHANMIAAISPEDEKLLRLKFSNVYYLPVFHQNSEVTALSGKGTYALYHGNLSVAENNEAALWLVEKVFNDLPFPLVVAGNNPTAELKRAIEQTPNVKLRHRLSTTDINALVRNAQMNVLPTFQNTGMKLKLINTLFMGRAVLVNPKMVDNTGLEKFCHIATTPVQFKKTIRQLFEKEFSSTEMHERQKGLGVGFSNKRNCEEWLGELGIENYELRRELML